MNILYILILYLIMLMRLFCFLKQLTILKINENDGIAKVR